ncbi:hypothetical protein EPN44_09775 [bacterium]|nr:MAG: hypothetical protein EPN44_09775 [bacterium]
MSRGWSRVGLLALALLGATLSAAAAAPPPTPVPAASALGDPIAPDASRVLALLAERNAALEGYSFDLRVKIAMHTFPWLQPYLIGSGTYEKPGRYSIAFRQVPALAKNYQKVTGEMLDPASWPQKYTISVGRQDSADVELILHERIKGEITEARATIDANTGSVKRMRFLYEHGGTIEIVQRSAGMQGFVLPVTQDAEIAMPGFKATAHAAFSNYRLTVGSATPASGDHVVHDGS